MLVAVSYRPVLRQAAGRADAHDADCHTPDHVGHDHADHDHSLHWGGLLIVILPVALGILVPPQPLGVSALATRDNRGRTFRHASRHSHRHRKDRWR
ncbi:MAG: hypothetical protein R2911_09775 [Caldilineaceae bacterium]